MGKRKSGIQEGVKSVCIVLAVGAALGTGLCLLSPPVLADGWATATRGDLADFLKSLEGSWRGEGNLMGLQPDGWYKSGPMGIDLEVQPGWESNWRIRSQVQTEWGAVLYDTTEYTVRGEFLFAGPSGALGPARVTESTPFAVAYVMRRADGFTGRVYDLQARLELEPSLRTLQGQVTVESNGVVLQQESFTARR